MRFLSIDSYLADLNVVVDHLGGKLDVVGLCQGGWLALMYAARFPAKVGKLVLVGAPIDNGVGGSGLAQLARNTPLSIFKEMVDLGQGRILGQHMLQFWAPYGFDREALHELLQPVEAIDSAAFRRLEARFRDWYAWTVDLPGVYYLEVVDQLFRENRLAGGSFVGLGERIDLSRVRCPVFLLAARDDELVAPEQIFATAGLVGCAPSAMRTMIAPGGHLGLFMGRTILSDVWPGVVRWLAEDDRARGPA
jgi:poly(3-hydroxyalkanoate) synthetase